MALVTSSSVGLTVSISRNSSAGLISASTDRSSLLSTRSKCYFQHVSSSSVQPVSSPSCFQTEFSASLKPLLRDLAIR